LGGGMEMTNGFLLHEYPNFMNILSKLLIPIRVIRPFVSFVI